MSNGNYECDYSEQDVSDLDRCDLGDLIINRLDDPDVDSVRLLTRRRKTILQTFYTEIDLSEFDLCEE